MFRGLNFEAYDCYFLWLHRVYFEFFFNYNAWFNYNKKKPNDGTFPTFILYFVILLFLTRWKIITARNYIGTRVFEDWIFFSTMLLIFYIDYKYIVTTVPESLLATNSWTLPHERTRWTFARTIKLCNVILSK